MSHLVGKDLFVVAAVVVVVLCSMSVPESLSSMASSIARLGQ